MPPFSARIEKRVPVSKWLRSCSVKATWKLISLTVPAIVVLTACSGEAQLNPRSKQITSLNAAESASKHWLIKRVEPQYPAEARAKCIEGDVHVAVTIAPEGQVRSAKATSGPPALQDAAVQAVKQWKYEPYLLNGKKMEVRTEATLDFHAPASCTPKPTIRIASEPTAFRN